MANLQPLNNYSASGLLQQPENQCTYFSFHPLLKGMQFKIHWLILNFAFTLHLFSIFDLISLLCQFNNLIQMLLHMFCKSNPRKIKSFLYARWAPIVFSAGATPFTPFTPWQLHCQWPSLIGYYLLSYFNSMIPCVVKCLWVWVL